ncbi:hypothetical protein TUMEXPCC7403_05900 [Tumidithrix helvetica PCC 7403]|uniref:PRC-barrel domain-containing protein n=1 Tax=Tumidithrix helvetica TaxID=3457545 RepID=UPI003C8B62A8
MDMYFHELIGIEVITSDGIVIGRIKNIVSDENRGIGSLAFVSSCLFPIPERYRSVYQICFDDIAVIGMEYLIVRKGVEKKLVRLTVGLIDRFIVRLPFPRKLFSPDHSVPVNVSRFDGNSGTTPIAVRPQKPSPILPDASVDETQ